MNNNQLISQINDYLNDLHDLIDTININVDVLIERDNELTKRQLKDIAHCDMSLQLNLSGLSDVTKGFEQLLTIEPSEGIED